MEKRMNCWEYKGCEEETRNKCPAYTMKNLTGVNHGKCGGRCCWAVLGSQCEKRNQIDNILQIMECLVCNFLRKIVKEEDEDLKTTCDIFKMLNVLPENCPCKYDNSLFDRMKKSIDRK